jgi:acetoin utilization deacetylase AcuC-like enzyme
VLAQLGWYSFDDDPILAGTWEAAAASVACAVAAADAVEAGARAAYALCRPPGHHAGAECFGGYCYLNNAAIAAARLAARSHRVAVLDLDAHHGNGTQAIFWERGDVVTISIHGDPDVHYPFFGGYADERGSGAGDGAHHNFPLPTGTDGDTYLGALDDALATIAAAEPDAVVVSLGVDTDAADGVFSLGLDDFRRIGAAIARLGRPLVVVQEGGYGPEVLERDVAAVLTEIASA